MSYAQVSKTHVDGLVTAAIGWNVISREDAVATGMALLQQNWNTLAYGEDPDQLDEEERLALDEEAAAYGMQPPTAYVYEPLPGEPDAAGVLQLISSYRYQSNWEGTGLGKVESVVDALERAAQNRPGTGDETGVPWLPSDPDRGMFGGS